MEEIDLKRMSKTFFSLKWWIMIIIILSCVAGYCYSYIYKNPKYKADSTIVLTQIVSDSTQTQTNESITTSDITINKSLVKDYYKIITNSSVLKEVLVELDLHYTENQLKKMINVINDVDSSSVLTIEVSSENPEEAQKITNKVAQLFTNKVEEVYKINNVNILNEAELPEEPYNINHTKDLLMFFVLGVFASGALVLLVYMFDTTIKEDVDIESSVGLPLIGIIPLNANDINKRKSKRNSSEVKLLEESKIHSSEAFRTLRTNLAFSQKNRNMKNILMTSSFSGEGKSYVSTNLAIAFANSKKRVVLVDADMRRGVQYKKFKIPNSKGLSNALSELKTINYDTVSKYIKETKVPNVHVITAGDTPTNPSELISSSKIARIIEVLDNMYDIVIIDGTPSILVSDSIALAKYVDNIIVVTEYKQSKIENVKKVKKAFENVSTVSIGAVINKVPREESSYGNYYYGEKNSEKLKEEQRYISVKEIVEDAKNRKPTSAMDYVAEVQEEEEHQEEGSTEIGAVKDYTGGKARGGLVEYKIENIYNEISSLKSIFIKYMMMNSENSISKEEFNELKKSIESLKVIETKQDDYSKEVKAEIEELKNITQNLVEDKKKNDEKIKKFIEDYRNRF